MIYLITFLDLLVIGICSVLYIAAMVQLWKMKKGGVIAYIALTILVDILGFFTGFWNLSEAFMPLLFIILMISQYRRMV